MSRFRSSQGPGFSQAVNVKFLSSSRIHDESDPIDPTQKHKFQFRIHDESDPIDPTHQSSSSQGPVSVQFLSSSCRGSVPVKVPVPAKLSRSSSCQVPGSTTSPIPSIRLRNIRFSSRIHDESDPIDPTNQSSSCQGSVPVKAKVQFQFQFQDPSPFQIQPYESDPIDPTPFYISVAVPGSSPDRD